MFAKGKFNNKTVWGNPEEGVARLGGHKSKSQSREVEFANYVVTDAGGSNYVVTDSGGQNYTVRI